MQTNLPFIVITIKQPQDSSLLYSNLYAKEYGTNKHASSITIGTCATAIPQEILIQIFEKLFSQDILALSQANRSLFLLTNNANKNFWDAYAPGIVHLNLNPGKSIFTCMINSGEEETCHLLKKFISKIEPFQHYLLEGSFLSSYHSNEKKTILEPSIELEVGDSYHEKFTSKKFIFRKEFDPSFCELFIRKFKSLDFIELFSFNFNTHGKILIPSNFVYFNICNTPKLASKYKIELDKKSEIEMLISFEDQRESLKDIEQSPQYIEIKQFLDDRIKEISSYDYKNDENTDLKITSRQTASRPSRLRKVYLKISDYVHRKF